MTERLHFHFSLSCIREGNGSLIQCSCLENPRDGGARWAAIYGVTQSRTQLKRLSSRDFPGGPVVMTPSDPMDCSPPGSSVHGIFQARVLEWGAIAFSRSFRSLFFCPWSLIVNQGVAMNHSDLFKNSCLVI